jgi:YbbR domain-containing protein
VLRPPQVPQWRRIGTPIALAVVSLFAALILWIAVSDAENPQDEVEIPGNQVVVVNVPEGLAVRSISPNPVRLTVLADSDIKERLTPSDFAVTVDLTGARDTADVALTANVVNDNRNVEIKSVSPEVVTIVLEPVVSKMVPVIPNTVGSIPQGYTVPSAPEVNPSSVKITGAGSLVSLVEMVTADVNLTGLRTTLTQQATLVPRDARRLEISRVTVDPPRVETKVTVQQQDISLQVPVVASLQGSVADGYNIVGVVVDPGTVPITGSLEATQALASVSTESVELSNLTRDFTRTVRLRLPSGVQSARDTVTVRVRIAPAQGEILVSVAPQASNVPDGLTASFQTSAITVRLAGDLPALKTVTPGTIRATVNASGLPEGVKSLEPEISNLPQGVQLVSVDPSQVVLVLRK